MGAHEVTQEQYQKVMGKNPSWFSAAGGGNDKVAGLDTQPFPVETVSWEEAVAFCTNLSELPEEKRAGWSYRLPTEAEWEYACRGGAATSTPFGFGTSLSSTQANFDGNDPSGEAARGPYLGRTCAVGSYRPNGFGLHDLHGNVWEWCADRYGPYPATGTLIQDPTGPTTGDRRVLRGGSWYFYGRNCRTAYRSRNDPGFRNNDFGFRVVCLRVP
jgi:formylglycine-generating enzyme required for sulfatase activity